MAYGLLADRKSLGSRTRSRQRLECYCALQHFKVRLLAALSAWLRRRLWPALPRVSGAASPPASARSASPDVAISIDDLSEGQESSEAASVDPAAAAKVVGAYESTLQAALAAHTRRMWSQGVCRADAVLTFAMAPARSTFLQRRLEDVRVRMQV